ncbi:MAG: YidC/Oxa1 family membrane protein insertase [Oscillospiraceae bacterium]|nr:YidC/Oxa1 family membrane protein insertase [Oscillospiraceae bacterium]
MYLIVKDFGWAVILFTLLVKAASFPLTLKQQKNMAVSQLFTPRVQEIQRKYRGNQQKMQEEMQKLQKEGYSPMGGCGPMILTMIILFGVLDVVYKPMTHIERFDKLIIEQTVDLSKQVEFTSIVLENEESLQAFLEYREIREPAKPRDPEASEISNEQRREIGEYIFNNLSTLNQTGLSDTVIRSITNANRSYVGLRQELIAVSQFSRSPEAFSIMDSADFNKLDKLKDNMVFLGIMDLASVPQLRVFNGLWIIAFLCFGFSVVQVVVQRRIQKETMPNMPNAGMMRGMMFIGPVFAIIIVFQFPAGAGLYWSISNLLMIIQSLIIFKFWPPEKMRQEAKDKVQASLGEVTATATVVDVDEEGNETVTETKVSDMSKREQEEYFKKKLEAARKADAEKYGDETNLTLDSESENNNEGNN